MKALAVAMLIVCGAWLARPAVGAVLYKSVGADGVVQFSDLPPDKAQNVKRIVIQDSLPSSEEELRAADAADAAEQRASAQLDMAEHALAMARRSLWSEPNMRKIGTAPRSSADNDRVAFYKKNVVIARAALLDLLREKRKAEARSTYTASAQ